MKYFSSHLIGQFQNLDDLDITVHCDVMIFRWLMKYVTRSQKKVEKTYLKNKMKNGRTTFCEKAKKNKVYHGNSVVAADEEDGYDDDGDGNDDGDGDGADDDGDDDDDDGEGDVKKNKLDKYNNDITGKIDNKINNKNNIYKKNKKSKRTKKILLSDTNHNDGGQGTDERGGVNRMKHACGGDMRAYDEDGGNRGEHDDENYDDDNDDNDDDENYDDDKNDDDSNDDDDDVLSFLSKVAFN